MNNARLHDGGRIDRLDRLREALQPVDAAEQDVVDAALPELVEDLHPELRALGLLEPHPEYVALPLDRDAEREVTGASLHRAALANLEDERVEEDHRVDVIERTLLPLAHVLHHRVGDPADQVTADLDAVDLGQVRLDVTRRQATRVESKDLVVEALEAPLTLPDDLRLKRPFPITRGTHVDGPVLGRQRLRGRAVTGVASAAGRLLVRLVAGMLGQLRRHRALHKPLGQLGEHTARPDDLLLRPGAGKQLVDHLIGKTIANSVRDRERRPVGRALRSPPGSLRAPPTLSISSSVSVLAFVDMTLLFGHAYTADRTLPALRCRAW
jgi:hypothetical protein